MYYENVQKTNNTLLGKDDLALKMKILQNEKINACKKTKYWQHKCEAENYLLDEDDDTNFRSKFSAIDESLIPERFELLMSPKKRLWLLKKHLVDAGIQSKELSELNDFVMVKSEIT